jgi:hypothetical protein
VVNTTAPEFTRVNTERKGAVTASPFKEERGGKLPKGVSAETLQS